MKQIIIERSIYVPGGDAVEKLLSKKTYADWDTALPALPALSKSQLVEIRAHEYTAVRVDEFVLLDHQGAAMIPVTYHIEVIV